MLDRLEPRRPRAATRCSPTSRASCAAATSTSRSIAAARERGLRRDGGRTSRRWPRIPSAPTATSASPRSSTARSRWRRCSSARMRDGGAGAAPRAAGDHDPPLLPHARRSRPFAEAIVDGHRSCSPRYEHEGRRRHLAAAFVDLAELDGRRRSALADARRRLPDGELAVADLYARADGRRRARGARRASCARRSPASRCRPSVAARRGRRRRPAARPRHVGRRRRSRFRLGRRRPGRGRARCAACTR